MTVHSPRDRNGSFSPEIIKKRQTDITGWEDKVLYLYSKGLSYQSISEQDIYGYSLFKSNESHSNMKT